MIGHLREEKDPLRAAFAVRQLPVESRIQVTHIGQALGDGFGAAARAETDRNPRYRWLGSQSHRKTRERLARANLLCISSKMEGSSNVLSEALASAVPVVATKISGLVGTLGSDFPGYYPVGSTAALRRLLLRAEGDRNFYNVLKRHSKKLAYLVKPRREMDAWRRLLRESISRR